MTPEDHWVAPAPARDPHVANVGSLRVALLFGAGAVVVALLVAPLAETRGSQLAARSGASVDRMSTGSVRTGGKYTIRRSVLQTEPNSVCIIHPSGARTGDC